MIRETPERNTMSEKACQYPGCATPATISRSTGEWCGFHHSALHAPVKVSLRESTPEPQTPALERFTLSDNQRYLDTNRQMEADADGEWVRYSDVASLLADRERLQTENKKAPFSYDDAFRQERDEAAQWKSRAESAEAAVERLTRENAELRKGPTHTSSAEIMALKRAESAERRAEALKEALKLVPEPISSGKFCPDCGSTELDPGQYRARLAHRSYCWWPKLRALLTEPDPHV